MKLEEYRQKRRQDPKYIAAKKELQPVLDFADKVLDLRLEKGWTQLELARRADVKQSDIARIESGLAEPSIETLRKLAKVLNCDKIESSVIVKRTLLRVITLLVGLVIFYILRYVGTDGIYACLCAMSTAFITDVLVTMPVKR